MLKGNHEYWWSGMKKFREFLEREHFKNIEFLHNNAYEVEGYIVCRNKRLEFWRGGRRG